MTIALRADASRAVVVLDGVDRVAFNEDGSMELLTPTANPTGNKVPTSGQLPDVTLVAAAAQSASGTSVDFTGIPVWAKRITVMFSGVSVSGTSIPKVQLGTFGGVETSGYSGTGGGGNSGFAVTGYGAANGAVVANAITAGDTLDFCMTITKVSGNTWVFSGAGSRGGTGAACTSGGAKTLAGVLDRVRITTVNGTDTFDAGTVNIMWE